MKFTKSPQILTLAALLCSSSVWAADTTTLFDEQFETPDGVTRNYPPSDGEKFVWTTKSGSAMVGAWSIGRQVAVTYAEKVGVKDSGGLDCRLEKAGGLYAVVNLSEIAFPDVDQAAGLTYEKVASLKISIAAKVPDGEQLEVALSAAIPKDSPDDAFKNRILFPPLKGTGAYETYEYSVADVPAEKVEAFIQIIKNAMAAGMPKAAFNLGLTYGKSWPQGTSFQLDDTVVTMGQ